MDTITLTGKIIFEPVNLTKKQKGQASWKRIAFVEFEGDICQYYSWFIYKRYSLVLNKSIRNPHVTIINDSIKDLSQDGKLSIDEVNNLWEVVKTKYDGIEIDVVLDVDVRSDAYYWWLVVPHDERILLQGIREELGLGTPYWGLHLSVGYAHPHFEEHSEYIHRMIKNGLITT